jgi:hypothetical protein
MFELVINLKTANVLGLVIPDQIAHARRRGDRIAPLFAAARAPFLEISARPLKAMPTTSRDG